MPRSKSAALPAAAIAVLCAACTPSLEDRSLTHAEMLADLTALTELIDGHYAYAALHPEARAHFAELPALLPQNATAFQFGLLLQEALAGFRDGHTGVRGLTRTMRNKGSLPCIFTPLQDRIVVRTSDDSAVLDPDHPFLVAVNDVAVDDLLAEAGRFISFANAATARSVAADRLRYAPFLLERLTERTDTTFTLLLANKDGDMRSTPLTPSAEADEEEEESTWSYRSIDSSIGYLRIPSFSMAPEQEEIEELMTDLAGTQGLVIDVRDNTGGSRAFLWRLAPYFIVSPLVVNAAVFRTDDRQHPSQGYLMDRYLFLENAGAFLPGEEQAIARFKASFHPAWPPPDGAFSPWHFMVISPSGTHRYTKPVIVLQNERCFSATDVFCSAFGQMEQVMLMGTTTGGGSGRPITYELPNSGLEVRLSSMASFRPDGTLFEGAGVVPDIEVRPTLNDLSTGSDALLDLAIDRLRGR